MRTRAKVMGLAFGCGVGIALLLVPVCIRNPSTDAFLRRLAEKTAAIPGLQADIETKSSRQAIICYAAPYARIGGPTDVSLTTDPACRWVLLPSGCFTTTDGYMERSGSGTDCFFWDRGDILGLPFWVQQQRFQEHFRVRVPAWSLGRGIPLEIDTDVTHEGPLPLLTAGVTYRFSRSDCRLLSVTYHYRDIRRGGVVANSVAFVFRVLRQRLPAWLEWKTWREDVAVTDYSELGGYAWPSAWLSSMGGRSDSRLDFGRVTNLRLARKLDPAEWIAPPEKPVAAQQQYEPGVRKLLEETKDPAQRAMLLLWLGHSIRQPKPAKAGELDEYTELLRAAVAECPAILTPWMYLVQNAASRKDRVEFDRVRDEIIRRFPGQADELFQLTQVTFHQDLGVKGELELASQWLAACPQSAQAAFYKAEMYESLGKFTDAIRCLDELVARPDLVASWRIRALAQRVLVYKVAHDKPKAKAAYRTLLNDPASRYFESDLSSAKYYLKYR